MITIRGENVQEPDGDLDKAWCLILDEHETGRQVIVHLGYAKDYRDRTPWNYIALLGLLVTVLLPQVPR